MAEKHAIATLVRTSRGDVVVLLATFGLTVFRSLVEGIVVGFALGTDRVNLVVAAVTIAAVSVALSLLGLEIGGRLGERLGQRSELVGGVVLILVGVAVASGLL